MDRAMLIDRPRQFAVRPSGGGKYDKGCRLSLLRGNPRRWRARQEPGHPRFSFCEGNTGNAAEVSLRLWYIRRSPPPPPPTVSRNRGEANEHSLGSPSSGLSSFPRRTENEPLSPPSLHARFPYRISGRFERAKRDRSPCETGRPVWLPGAARQARWGSAYPERKN